MVWEQITVHYGEFEAKGRTIKFLTNLPLVDVLVEQNGKVLAKGRSDFLGRVNITLEQPLDPGKALIVTISKRGHSMKMFAESVTLE